MRVPRSLGTMYSSLWTYRAVAQSLASPITVLNFTDLSQYVKRFASEGPNQPIAQIRKAWMTYQFDAISGTPTPLVVHLWFVQPRTLKLQSVLNGYLTATEVASDIDANADGSDPLLNLQNYRLRAYRKHILSLTSSAATASVAERTKFGAVKLRMPKFFKNESATQNWTQLSRAEIRFTDQMYCIIYLEVQSSTTPTAVQFCSNTTLKVLQAM